MLLLTLLLPHPPPGAMERPPLCRSRPILEEDYLVEAEKETGCVLRQLRAPVESPLSAVRCLPLGVRPRLARRHSNKVMNQR